MNEERDRILTEAMGECRHDRERSASDELFTLYRNAVKPSE